tara:strand:- start:602 stop:970 length:369 start_codon:yes stop_codon:yes gene_type:complete
MVSSESGPALQQSTSVGDGWDSAEVQDDISDLFAGPSDSSEEHKVRLEALEDEKCGWEADRKAWRAERQGWEAEKRRELGKQTSKRRQRRSEFGKRKRSTWCSAMQSTWRGMPKPMNFKARL